MPKYVPERWQCPERFYNDWKERLEVVSFLRKRSLVAVPPLANEIWRMTMLSPEWQRTTPYFLGGEVVRIAFPSESMTHENKLMIIRGNNRHFSRAVVHHELIPGHHL